jgi:hypothetical protein
LLRVEDPAQRKQLNKDLTGFIGNAGRIRVDERGIEMPDWWDDSDTTESTAMQSMFDMKSWKGGA